MHDPLDRQLENFGAFKNALLSGRTAHEFLADETNIDLASGHAGVPPATIFCAKCTRVGIWASKPNPGCGAAPGNLPYVAQAAQIEVHVEIEQIFSRMMPRAAVAESQLLKHFNHNLAVGERVRATFR